MKKVLSCVILISSLLLLNACSFSEIQIERNSDEISDIENNIGISDTDISIPEDFPQYVELGETFVSVNNILHNGTGVLNVSIDKATVFNTLEDAGIELDETFEDSVVDGLNYDAKSGEFLNNRVVVMVHITVENVNAISGFFIDEPEKYDEYDFRVDALGSCGYFIYSSKAKEHRTDECSNHYCVFHLEPKEKTEIECAYLVDLREVDLKDLTFSTAATPENGTIVNLNLGLGKK